MNRILSDEEILAAFESADGTFIASGRAVIAAYEAKLREQKPVMWKADATNELDIDGEESLVICLTEEIMSTYRDESNYLITPLFEHPAPIPEGWKELMIRTISRMRAAHVPCADIERSAEAILAAARSE